MKILHVFSSLLREEELRDAYEEVMPIIREAIVRYEESLRQEKGRLRPTEKRGIQTDAPLPSRNDI
jgi:hypothetical protein